MATLQAEIRSPSIELSPEAFKVFCQGISGVFDVDIQCNEQQAVATTIPDLEQRFGKLAVVDCVMAEGVIEGALQFVFDRQGLFTLVGVLLGMPEAEILQNTEHGSLQDAEDLSDAIREIGHLMAGAWKRLFSEKFDNPSHFVKISTFIGYPWDNTEEKLEMPGDQELLLVPHEITIGPYATFECGVIIPEAVLAGGAVSVGEEAAEAAREAELEAEAGAEEETEEATGGRIEAGSEETAEAVAQTEIEARPEEKAEAVAQADSQAGSEEKAEAVAQVEIQTVSEEEAEVDEGQIEAESQEDTEEVAEGPVEAVSEKEAEESTEESSETEAEEVDSVADQGAISEEPEASAEAEDAPPDVDAGDDVAEEEPAQANQSEEPTGVSETIQKMTQSSASLPGESAQPSLAIPVVEIMQKEVVWGSPDDSVQQTLTKMQHHDVGYIMVGDAGVLEGVVSQSDLTGAISPYLRPIFSKWRRPSDDATLQIKIKWIMSKLVRTIRPQASVAAAMEKMCNSGGGCLPVVDQQARVQGLVTAFDIFKALSAPGVSGAGASSGLRTSA